MRPANLCRSCGEDFAYLSAFDEHRVGTHDYTLGEGIRREPPVYDGRRCLDEHEMLAVGWHRDRHGRWHTGVREQILERVEL